MNKIILVLALLWAIIPAKAQTQLQPGDIAILGYQTDNPDEFSFLALKEISSGTQISFTDNGWNGSALTTNEGTFLWTATTNIVQGAVVNVLPTSVAFSTTGDQIIAYQGSASAPNFIYALTSNAWVTGSILSTTSRIPAGLTDGLTAVSFSTEQNNGFFNQLNASGSRGELLALIGNSNNWTRSATRFSSFPTWSFQVVVPQPPSGGGGGARRSGGSCPYSTPRRSSRLRRIVTASAYWRSAPKGRPRAMEVMEGTLVPRRSCR
jgi:hypothetical protein